MRRSSDPLQSRPRADGCAADRSGLPITRLRPNHRRPFPEIAFPPCGFSHSSLFGLAASPLRGRPSPNNDRVERHLPGGTFDKNEPREKRMPLLLRHPFDVFLGFVPFGFPSREPGLLIPPSPSGFAVAPGGYGPPPDSAAHCPHTALVGLPESAGAHCPRAWCGLAERPSASGPGRRLVALRTPALRRGTEKFAGASLACGLRRLCNRKRFAGRLRQAACPSETLCPSSTHSVPPCGLEFHSGRRPSA